MGQQQQSTDCALLLLLFRTKGCMDMGKAKLGKDKDLKVQQ